MGGRKRMKNIYILSTNKPSRLHNTFNFLRLESGFDLINQNIYITSDEEIKEGDWIYGLFNGGVVIRSEFDVPKNSQYYKEYGLKIILTTDQDLIKDGVQAITNTFAEWFIKNPSCEWVEIETKDNWYVHTGSGKYWEDEPIRMKRLLNLGDYEYKIIIPKEEPKQEKTFDDVLDESLSKGKLILEELKSINLKREKLEEDTEKLKELWKISEDKDLGEFIKGGKYIQQDGVIILAGENKTDGIVITDHKNTRGIGYYSDCWNPKAFKLYEEPKPYTKWEQDKDKYSEEDMVKFSSWILLQDITSRGEGNYVNTDGKIVTVKDLFEQFKKK
jgi:hypothetical protein